MAWDPNRPVPWKKLMRLFGIYFVGAIIISFIFFRDQVGGGLLYGLVLGGILYATLAAAMVKFGWDPPALRTKESVAYGAERAAASSATTSSGKTSSATTSSARASTPAASRPKPPPTSRTSTGHNTPRKKRK